MAASRTRVACSLMKAYSSRLSCGFLRIASRNRFGSGRPTKATRRTRNPSLPMLAALPDPPSYSATRALLRVLEDKGHVRHEADGPRYVFSPLIPRDRARRSALKHLLQTFFDNSATDAVAALLDTRKVTPEELDR